MTGARGFKGTWVDDRVSRAGNNVSSAEQTNKPNETEQIISVSLLLKINSIVVQTKLMIGYLFEL